MRGPRRAARLQVVDDAKVDHDVLCDARVLVDGARLHAEAQLHALLAQLERELLPRQVLPLARLAEVLHAAHGK